MARMETDYSKQTHIRWKIKWRLEHLGALGIMGLSRRPLMVHVGLTKLTSVYYDTGLPRAQCGSFISRVFLEYFLDNWTKLWKLDFPTFFSNIFSH